MGRGWQAVKAILGLHLCSLSYQQQEETTLGDFNGGEGYDAETSDVQGHNTIRVNPRSTSPSPSRVHACRSTAHLARSSCAICLETMKPGHGQALFTAECSHTFHFLCITANVRYGSFVCPICRAKWKDVPWQAALVGGVGPKQLTSDDLMRQFTLRRGPIYQTSSGTRNDSDVLRAARHNTSTNGSRPASSDPEIFDDDEPLTVQRPSPNDGFANSSDSTDSAAGRDTSIIDVAAVAVVPDSRPQGVIEEEEQMTDQNRQEAAARNVIQKLQQVKVQQSAIELTAFAEVGAIASNETRDDFTVLIHLKAPASERGSDQRINSSFHAPIDLVTVLDVSGSMAGAKLRLLKRAMYFVIANLTAGDRLSVIAFSSTATRVLPLRRMTQQGKLSAKRSINGLTPLGGTNIVEGLRKGAKVLDDRRARNPVASIILLSDGQDMHNMSSLTHEINNFENLQERTNQQRLLHPRSIRQSATSSDRAAFPIHTFGFGADHDADIMHLIAEMSGGMFSFIQAEEAVQDAFAQCIGGLLSVVVQDVEVVLSAGTDNIQIKKIQAGSYESSIGDSGQGGSVKFGDMYADEERDILLELQIPACKHSPVSMRSDVLILKAECIYKDPVSRTLHRISLPRVSLSRPENVVEDQHVISLEIDRQRNRLRAAQSISSAALMADSGDIAGARQTLEDAKDAIRSSECWRTEDRQSKALEAELVEIQARIENRQLYERYGRPYILSAHSSHCRQRATTRGESVDSHSNDYQTPSMVNMVFRSQSRNLQIPPAPSTRAQEASPGGRPNRRKINVEAVSRSAGNR